MKRRSAFTLMELILVLAILLLLAFLTYPAFDAMREAHAVTRGVDDTRTAWVMAQARASEDGRSYRFAIVPGTGNWRIAPDSEAYWSGGGMTGDATTEETDTPPLVLEGSLPNHVFFLQSASDQPIGSDTILPEGTVPPDRWVTVAVFLPDGTARDDAMLGIGCGEVPPHRLHLRAMTGVIVVIHPGEDEDQQ